MSTTAIESAVIKDTHSRKKYDLSRLVEEHIVVSIGRAGPIEAREINKDRCIIELGIGITIESLKKKSDKYIVNKVREFEKLGSVSRHHATITYRFQGSSHAWAGGGYYITDHSHPDCGITVENPKHPEAHSLDGRAKGPMTYHHETFHLIDGDILYFGKYGGVEFRIGGLSNHATTER